MTHNTNPGPGRAAASRTLVDVLRWRTEAHPDRLAYVFLRDGEVEDVRWTYADMAAQAARVAARLRERCRQGDRALIVYPPGLDFVAAFLGCLSAGIVAVPVASPRRTRDLQRLEPILDDARPAVVLTTSEMSRALGFEAGGRWRDFPVLTCDTGATDAPASDALASLDPMRGERSIDRMIAPDDLALLQYTSGSTAAPRGVMVRHRHLMANEEAIARAFRHDAETVVAGWLPFFHDMGLIGNLLQPLYAGVPCVFMPPVAFMQRPVRWLRMIAAYRATTSGGPDFAYDLCARKVADEEKQNLDLSGWRVAFTGAEPVRADTLRRFNDAFAPCGFSPSAWLPCFGLAEATLMVSGRARAAEPTLLDVDREALGNGRVVPAGARERESDVHVRRLVACGPTVEGTTIAIVNPDTRRRLREDEVGEIWVAGSGVADGYWSDARATTETFHARLSDDDDVHDGTWLRTGDLGFVRASELFIAGRLKDLIIVRGRNHHPADLEATIGRAHAALHPGGGAVFAIERDGEERVIAVQECTERRLVRADEILADRSPAAQPSRLASPASAGASEIHAAIRAVVSRDHDLELDAIVLVARGAVPKTTSGKTRRGACRDLYLNGALPAIASWSRAAGDQHAPGMTGGRVEEVVAGVLGRAVHELPLDEPLVRLGLSSLRAFELLHALEEQFDLHVTLDDLLDRLTIGGLIARRRDLDVHAGVNGSRGDRPSVSLPASLPPSTQTPAWPRAYPLSANQQSIYAAQQLDPESAAYHICCAARIEGLDLARLREALARSSARHPALRARVELRDGRPWQVIEDSIDLPWAEVAASSPAIEALIAAARPHARQPFLLNQAPLWRATLVRPPAAAENRAGHAAPNAMEHAAARDSASAARGHLLLLTFHHLIADLWSLAIVWRELLEALGTPAVTSVPLSSAADGYAAFVESQDALLASDRSAPLRAFWTRKLGADPPVLALPTKSARPARQRHEGARDARVLDDAVVSRLTDLSTRFGVTSFVTLLAVFETLLSRYTGQTAFLIGTPTAGRERTETRDTVGYFVNPVALRADLSGDPTFLDLVSRAWQEVREALTHAAYPFTAVADLARPRHELDRAPLCDVMFVYQEAPQGGEALGAFTAGVDADAITIGGGSLQPMAFDPGTSQRDLTVTVAHVSGRLVVSAEYDTDLFDGAFVGTLLGHYEQLLDRCLTTPARPLSRIAMLSASERASLLGSRPVTQDELSTACLHERFAAQAARTPEAVAVRCGNDELTYADLNRRANQLARLLRARGAGPDRLVAIDMERSPDLPVAIVATLKAGAAYLPLDPAYPRERVAFMLADARPVAIVTHAARVSTLPEELMPLRLCIDEARDALASQDASDLEALDLGARSHPLQLAYVIYTSGSTGRPKGCMVTHHNVLRLFDRLPTRMRFDANDVWTMFHSAAFDFSVWELWGAWLHGGRVVIVPQATCRDPEAFARLLREAKVTVLSQTPTAFQSLLQALGPRAHARLPHVRWIVFGGEALDFQTVAPWFGPDGESRATLVNMYGITETTVHVTYREVPYADVISAAAPHARGGWIGAPLPDLRLHLLGADLEPVPIGVTGEIYVGGPGLARGYLHRPDLTAARFVPDPFGLESGARLYRSGDLARRTAAGDIEYLGRSDDQIQLHGFRVEPGEIEAALARHPAVRQAVVMLRPVSRTGWAYEGDERPEPHWQVLEYRRYLKARPVERPSDDDRQLVAYVVPRDRMNLSPHDLRQYLMQQVPFYMLPAAFVILDRLPTTDSGKIHRAALPDPGAAHVASGAGAAGASAAGAATPPRTRAERLLLDAWRDALPPGEFGIDDNFFAAGGDSIRAIRVVARAAEGGVRLSVQDLYRHQTIRELAASVEQSVPASAQAPASAASGPASTIVDVPAQASRAAALIPESDRARLPHDVEDAYPLARMQAGLIYHSEQHPRSPVYRASFLYRFDGILDAETFRAAVRDLVDHHPILRTAFDLARYAEPLQVVHGEVDPSVTVEDLRAFDPAAQERAIEDWFERERTRAFDVTRPPLARFTAHHLSPSSFTVGLTCHDAILDGWSTALILTELLQRYAALRTRQLFAPPSPRSAYREFIALERETLAWPACRDFWMRTLDGCEVAPMPLTPPSSQQSGARGDASPRLGVVDVHVPRDLSDALLRIARQAGVPLKHLLLAVHLRVVQTWTGADDVITGLEVNGRPEQPGGEWSVGQHLNTVPFRLRIPRGTWRDLVQAVGAGEQALLPFRRWPYAEIQRQHGGVSLYDTTFNYTHFHVLDALRRLPDITLRAGHGRELTHYTLKTEFNRDVFTDRLHVDVIFDAERMAATQAQSIAASYIEALRSLADAPDARHDTRPLAGHANLQQAGEWATGPIVARPDTTITRLCEAQRDRTPAHTAVEMDGAALSYADLHARANRLARHLRARGIGPEDFVGVHLARSFDLMIALLAVLKAGAAYVPLDTSYPADRLHHMIARAGVRTIITTGACRQAFPASTIVAIDEDAHLWQTIEAGDPERDEHPLDAMYALFTSGSTGEPKGAINTHEGLCNRLLWMQDTFALRTDDRVLQKTPIGFDVSGWELWWPLITGATLVFARPGGESDGRYLAELIREARITTLHFVPSMLRLFLDEPGAPECVGLRRIICSGETLDAGLVRRCHDRLSCDLHNLYGPTEAAIDVTAWHCRRGDEAAAIPIGPPITNVRALVLDRDGHPVPPGAIGELYLAGPNLARGYVNQPDLTAERFVPCAFGDGEAGSQPGERIYRTGDRVRVRDDGAIEFLGRIDAQVKVHGVRIELGDVEAALARHPACAAVAATVQADAEGRAQLVAFIVGRTAMTWTAGDLRAFLRERLPAAMVPSRYVAIDALPRTPGGKLDRRRLPLQAPAAAIEESEALADLLRDVESLTDEDARSLLANAARG